MVNTYCKILHVKPPLMNNVKTMSNQPLLAGILLSMWLRSISSAGDGICLYAGKKIPLTSSGLT